MEGLKCLNKITKPLTALEGEQMDYGLLTENTGEKIKLPKYSAGQSEAWSHEQRS